MKIECVVICYNYSDFLEHTLPENLQHVDRMVVVTHPTDRKTVDLCTKHGVDCIETEVFHDRGDKFNKGRAVNLGLSHLRHDDWLLTIDADILLPHRFRAMLDHAKLNERMIYGADRLNVPGWDAWMAHKHKIVPQHQWRYMVTPTKEFPIGSRLLHQEYGYCPIGYFQLWHSKTGRKYPIISGSAEHDDVLFAVQWEREQRALLPEFFCYHLESEPDAAMGANWKGRKTKPFGPKPKP
jgi:glycosyltransferase involved in cell wall biosynthesis